MRQLRAERGASTVEYALMLALLAGVIVLALGLMSRSSSSTFVCVGQAIDTVDCSKSGCGPSGGKPPKCQF